MYAIKIRQYSNEQGQHNVKASSKMAWEQAVHRHDVGIVGLVFTAPDEPRYK